MEQCITALLVIVSALIVEPRTVTDKVAVLHGRRQWARPRSHETRRSRTASFSLVDEACNTWSRLSRDPFHHATNSWQSAGVLFRLHCRNAPIHIIITINSIAHHECPHGSAQLSAVRKTQDEVRQTKSLWLVHQSEHRMHVCQAPPSTSRAEW